MEQPQLKADYIEKIAIQPEDIIPKNFCLKFIKILLLIILIILILIASITVIITESLNQDQEKDNDDNNNNNTTYLTVGIISLIGITLFLFGLITIVKEHVPSIFIFTILMIFYLLLLMYSRIFDSVGWIIVRTIILLFIIIMLIIYLIMLRDWRQLQLSRLRQRAIKEQQYRQINNSNIRYQLPIRQHQQQMNNQINQYEHIYSQIGPPYQQQQLHQLNPQQLKQVQQPQQFIRSNQRMNNKPNFVLTTHYN